MIEASIQTKERYQLVDITDKIKEEVARSKVSSGTVLVFVTHTTAGLLVTENEPGLVQDWQVFLKKTVEGFNFQHDKIDNNADSHMLAGLLGESKMFIIDNSQLVLGVWQRIFLAEFDGPRERRVIVRVI